MTRATVYLGGKTKSFYVCPENGYYHRVSCTKLSADSRVITGVCVMLPVLSGKSVRFVLDLDKVASKEVKESLEQVVGKAAKNADHVAKFTNKQIDDYIKLATHNNNAPNVTLGKREDAYFDLGTDGWDNASKLVNGSRDEMWHFNQNFLDNQISKGKSFNLIHDPFIADGFYKAEIDYLISKGYKIVTEGRYWHATK